MDKRTQSMYISQCHICTLAPAMRHCNECQFKAGLEYWLCDCPDGDNIKHKSELFCLRCDTERPTLLFRPQPMPQEQIKALAYIDSLHD